MDCIILARGGSKRVKGKNIKLLNNIPLLAYSVKWAKDCGMTPHVATDSLHIAMVGKMHKAEIMWRKNVADEQTMRQALLTLPLPDDPYEYFCVTQCDVPYKTVDSYQRCKLNLYNNPSAVCTAVDVTKYVWWAKDEYGNALFHTRPYMTQNLSKAYSLTGGVIITNRQTIINNVGMAPHEWLGDQVSLIEVDWIEGMSLDTHEDFKTAEKIKWQNPTR